MTLRRSAVVALLAIGGISLGPPAGAVEPLRIIDWAEEEAAGRLASGQVAVASGGERHLLVSVEEEESGAVSLLTIELPELPGERFALVGRVAYRGADDATAYLEMWTVFPDESRYFTRTLAETGPMRPLVGDSDWRPFALPFSFVGAEASPVRIELGLVAPAPATVVLGPLHLVALEDGEGVEEALELLGR